MQVRLLMRGTIQTQQVVQVIASEPELKLGTNASNKQV